MFSFAKIKMTYRPMAALIAGVILIAGGQAQAGEWRQGPPLTRDLMGHHAEELDGTIYLFGGQVVPHRAGTTRDRAYALSLGADSWRELAPMPTPRVFFGTAVVDSKIYAIGGAVVGGERQPGIDTVEIYDPATDSWSFSAPLTVPRADHAAVAVNGKIYVVGGTRSVGIDALGTVEMFDPALGIWTRRRDMPTQRLHHTAVAHNGKIYVFGGSPEWPVPMSSVEIYDPKTDLWTTGADMPTPRTGLWAAVLGDKIYVAGGLGWDNQALNTVEVYDPASDSWSSIEDFPQGRFLAAVVALDGKLYVIGGAQTDYQSQSTVQIYTP